jgi:hypothetical protein
LQRGEVLGSFKIMIMNLCIIYAPITAWYKEKKTEVVAERGF